MFVKRPCHKKTYMEEQREKQLQVFKTADIQKARNLPGNKESKHQLLKISLLTHLVLSLIHCILQSRISSAGAAGGTLGTRGDKSIHHVPYLSFFLAIQTSPITNKHYVSNWFSGQVIKNIHVPTPIHKHSLNIRTDWLQ